MDGSDAKVIIEENLGWPNALAVAYETNEIFLAERPKSEFCYFGGGTGTYRGV